MSVRAKFYVDSVTHYNDTSEVHLNPVVNGSDENKSFFKWTPGGRISMSVLSRETASQFEPGKEYYVDFTPAE